MTRTIYRLLQLAKFGGRLPPVVRSVIADRITYLEPAALADLHAQARRIERDKVGGLFVECGTALGGAAIVMAKEKSKARPFHIYDAFGMIPPPSTRDGPDAQERYAVIQSGHSEGIAGETYYGYRGDLLETVRSNFIRYGLPPEQNNIHLVQGLFDQTIKVAEPVAFLHIDADWYDSVMVCLERLFPLLAPGGVAVIDDYDAWSGCRKAVDTFFAERSDFAFVRRARLHVHRR